MEHSFDSRTVADAFLDLAEKNNSTLTPMQLNKLVYIADGFFAGNTGNPLIRDAIEAWKYGPVIPVLYHACKKFGGNVITGRLSTFFCNEELSDSAMEVIQKVYNHYGRLPGVQLSNITHQPGTPWHQTYDGSFYRQIPHDLIENYYKNIIDN